MSGLLEETLEEDSLKTQWKACYQIILTALKFRTALKFQGKIIGFTYFS